MSDWQSGDIALCVKGGKITDAPYGAKGYPVAGKLYTVGSGGISMFYGGLKRYLDLVDGPINVTDRRWPSARFVKVIPPEADKFDRETIDLYNKKEKPADAKPKRATTTV
jgi:hypothetical protein